MRWSFTNLIGFSNTCLFFINVVGFSTIMMVLRRLLVLAFQIYCRLVMNADVFGQKAYGFSIHRDDCSKPLSFCFCHAVGFATAVLALHGLLAFQRSCRRFSNVADFPTNIVGFCKPRVGLLIILPTVQQCYRLLTHHAFSH